MSEALTVSYSGDSQCLPYAALMKLPQTPRSPPGPRGLKKKLGQVRGVSRDSREVTD